MAKTILKILASEHFYSEGKRPELSAISPKLKIFPYDESHEVDPITLEVVAHKLWQINDEQGQALKKISGSPVATDANDFNVVLCDELGDIVNIGPYYLPHAANVDFMVKWTVVNRSHNPGIHPEDMFCATIAGSARCIRRTWRFFRRSSSATSYSPGPGQQSIKSISEA